MAGDGLGSGPGRCAPTRGGSCSRENPQSPWVMLVRKPPARWVMLVGNDSIAESRCMPDAVDHHKECVGDVVLRDSDAASAAGGDDARRAATQRVQRHRSGVGSLSRRPNHTATCAVAALGRSRVTASSSRAIRTYPWRRNRAATNSEIVFPARLASRRTLSRSFGGSRNVIGLFPVDGRPAPARGPP